jgi:hypothetical protein
MAMKVNVVRDENGKVIATFENASPGGTSIAPILEAGHTVGEVEAGGSYHADIEAFYREHSR